MYKRQLYQRPEWPDLLEFSRTDENPYDEPDLDLWLHDSLDAETAMGGVIAVSYTHLDVYKRQTLPWYLSANFPTSL